MRDSMGTGDGATPQKVFMQKQQDGQEEISGIMHISDQQEKETTLKKNVSNAADDSLVVDTEITNKDIKMAEKTKVLPPPIMPLSMNHNQFGGGP